MEQSLPMMLARYLKCLEFGEDFDTIVVLNRKTDNVKK